MVFNIKHKIHRWRAEAKITAGLQSVEESRCCPDEPGSAMNENQEEERRGKRQSERLDAKRKQRGRERPLAPTRQGFRKKYRIDASSINKQIRGDVAPQALRLTHFVQLSSVPLWLQWVPHLSDELLLLGRLGQVVDLLVQLSEGRFSVILGGTGSGADLTTDCSHGGRRGGRCYGRYETLFSPRTEGRVILEKSDTK
ncbi:hypothetical protein EYF80_014541 [Liparis tanakae]|uniref:Uncharacterized protein n=1 Tax=Liparis tanakae TaxID=230148 RepID=A0A4Z2ID60_9TELE|nr:hypothetical protein EYF80_014541 [Liparis tanakae]